jgi:2-polyprenyl-3-methyl-5-hydroxy-6-metoxy-1,4-benzoquinol methylase
MNNNYEVLQDPYLGEKLKHDNNQLRCGDMIYPVIKNIPRFITLDNYAKDFGLQWNEFPKTQLDSYTGCDISEKRLARCLNGHLGRLAGKKILEAGSGAGRFTEVLLKYGGVVHSFDYSNAVEANALNNGHSNCLSLVQADIRAMPFPRSSYDYVICLGVLQHTPVPEESISCLWEMVKPGGYLVIDHYLFKLRHILPPPIGVAEVIYRRALLSTPIKERFALVKKIVDFWFPIHWKYKDSLIMQRTLRRVSPVHFYYPDLPLKSKELHYEWALLDTHDGTTDYYKHHRSVKQIYNYLKSLGGGDLVVREGGNGVEAFCKKPVSAI